MALKQIPKEKKEAYNAVVKDIKEQVDITEKRAQKLEREAMRDKELPSLYKRIAACSVFMDTVLLYCKMNEYSLQIMDIRNDLYLTNARKNIYQAIKMLETIVGVFVDTSLTDNADILARLTELTPKRLLHLLKKIEYSIALVEYAEGENSKWKWNFVEMYGKFAALTKNLINFKELVPKLYDPMYPYYQEVNELIALSKKAIEKGGQKYRTKYELSTRDVSDMNKGIDLLNLLVRIYIILNEQEIAQESKMTIEKWKSKLETDLRKKEEESKTAKRQAATPRRR